MAFTAVAAIASVGAVSAGVVAVETLAAVAAVTSVVGVVTKSKELTKIGAGMALGAAGAGVLGLGEAAGASTVAGADAAQGGAALTDAASGTAGGAGAATTGAADAATAANADAAGIAGGAATDSGALSGAGIINGAANPAAATASTAAPVADAAGGIGAPAGATAPAGPLAVDAPSAPWGAQSPLDKAIGSAINSTNPADFAGVQDSSSFFGNIGNWMENNKTLASGLMNIGGGLLKGAAEGYAADRNYNMQQGIINRQTANANAQPTINLRINPNANVFGNPPKTYNGIIAGARGG